MLASPSTSIQAPEEDITDAQAEHLEREAIKRGLFIMYCSSRSKMLDKPTNKNPKLKALSNIFLDSPEGFANYMPAQLFKHFYSFPNALNTQTTKLWFYTLASHVQDFLLTPQTIKSDILDALGENRLEAIRLKAANGGRVDPTLIENTLVYAYFKFLYRLLNGTRYARSFQVLYDQYIKQEDFTKTQILVKRKYAFLEQLNLCLNNDEHLAFWQRFVDPGLLGTGGTAVREYRIPGHIHTLMTNAHPNTHEPYAHFKARMDALRHQPSFFSFGRNSFSQAFYDFDDKKIEQISLNAVAARLAM